MLEKPYAYLSVCVYIFVYKVWHLFNVNVQRYYNKIYNCFFFWFYYFYDMFSTVIVYLLYVYTSAPFLTYFFFKFEIDNVNVRIEFSPKTHIENYSNLHNRQKHLLQFFYNCTQSTRRSFLKYY